jgi:hypothetical protein
MHTLPYRQPSSTCRVSATRLTANTVQVFVFEPDDLAPSPERALIAGGIVSAVETAATSEVRWEAIGMAACKGYGTFLYELCARLLRRPLHATDDQSEDAKRFWSRRGQCFIESLSEHQFNVKYNFDLAKRVSHSLSKRQIERLRSHAVDVFCGARMGSPARLLRETTFLSTPSVSVP